MPRTIGLGKLFLFLWVLLFLCLRPSILGERYNAVVFILLFVISIFVLYFFRKDLSRIKGRSLGLLMLIFVLDLYLFLQGIILSSTPQPVINSCVLIAGISVMSVYILSLDKIFIIKSIIYIHVILSLSSIATLLMLALNGFSSDGLISLGILNDFMNTPIPDSDNIYAYHHLFFPFSHSWADVGVLGIKVPRLLGIYREAGMAQIFFFTAYFLTYLVKLERMRLVRTILVIGGFLTFSTAGLLGFLGGYLILRFYPHRRIRVTLTKIAIIAMLLPLVIGAVFFTPDFGIVAKVNSTSGHERIKSYQRSWNKFLERPLLGHGFFQDFEKERRPDDHYVDTLGLIGIIYQIGAIGVILYFLPWFYSFYFFNNRKTYFVLIPCFLTLLFSQPSYIDMIVWFLLTFDFKSIVSPPNNSMVIAYEQSSPVLLNKKNDA